MDSIIRFSLNQRWLIVLSAFLIALLGIWNALRLPIDAVPDITNIQVQVNTSAPSYSPLEVEQRVTFAVENAMAGLPRLDYTRSLSRYGLSQVTVVFLEGTDIYWARQQVNERLQGVRSDLPSGLEPTLGPLASGLGEVFTYGVQASPGSVKADGTPYSLEDLRTIQDWIIRPQLLKVPGVTEINGIGGYVREYEVTPEPVQLLAFHLTVEDVVTTLERNNANTGAGYIERNGEQWLVRSTGQLTSIEDIRQLVITMRDAMPVRIGDVANVSFGRELRTGSATLNGEEAVLGTAFMLLGENSRTVAQDIASRLDEVNRTLPAGVQAVPLYNRSSLVDSTITTVRNNLLEGAALVIVILFLLLGNLRAALIAALVIPLSLLFGFSAMTTGRVSGNLMSLGAIDFGLIVDGAIIIVENALRRLGLAQKRLGRSLSLSERLEEVFQGTREVFRPAVFGLFIIMIVYLPIFALSGVEGRMFHPMAFTVVAVLLGALLFSMTFVPAAVAILVRGQIKEHDNRVMRATRKAYAPVLALSQRHPLLVSILALLVIVTGTWQATRLGTEFLPQLDEGDVALHAIRIPGTGMQQSTEMQKDVERSLLEFPQVEHVFSKIGTPEIATDPMPPSVADTFVILKPRSQWPEPTLSKSHLIAQMRQAAERVPGNQYEFTQPIEMRFNELIAGVRADVAVRIYGDDLQQLAAAGEQATALLSTIPGATDVRMEQMSGLPILTVEPKRDHMALMGLHVADVQRLLQAAVSGIHTGQVYEDDRRFPLLVRLPEHVRSSVRELGSLPLALPGDESTLRYVPLSDVATITMEQGPNQVNREGGKRNVIVSANVDGRDLGSFVEEAQSLISDRLDLPAGYWVEYGGTFEQLQSASQRLAIVVPLTLLLVLGLLYGVFNSLRDTLIIFSGVPFALTGGVLALTLRDMPLSISAGVGFIALCGIAVLNGIVMLSFIRQLRMQGQPLLEAVRDGAGQRLRPVLMTALVAALGLLPMALNTSMGAEVQRPLATVVIGGILSSTLLTLVVLPSLYQLAWRRSEAA